MAESQVALDVASEGGSASSPWQDFFEQTKTVIKGYGPVLVYYVKAHNTADWKNSLGEDFLEWSAADVLQQLQEQRDSLVRVGAHELLFSRAQELNEMLKGELQSGTDRLKFHSKATEFVERLPFVDLFPLNFEEKPGNRNAEMRKICGVFYSLKCQMDMPLRWFRYFAEQFRKSTGSGDDIKTVTSWREILENAFGESRNPAITDAEEDEFYLRHVLSEEALDSVVASIKRKRDDALRDSNRQQ